MSEMGQQGPQFSRFGPRIGGDWRKLNATAITADQSAPTVKLEMIHVHRASTVRFYVALGTLTSARLHLGRWTGSTYIEDRVELVEGIHVQVDLPAADNADVMVYLTHMDGSAATGATIYYQVGQWAAELPVTRSRWIEERAIRASAALGLVKDDATSRTLRADLVGYDEVGLLLTVTDWDTANVINVWPRGSGLVNPLVATPTHWSNLNGVGAGSNDTLLAAAGLGRFYFPYTTREPWFSALIWADAGAPVVTTAITSRRQSAGVVR